MRPATLALLFDPSRRLRRSVALVAVGSLAVTWLVGAIIGAVSHGAPWIDEVLHPRPAGAWTRVLVAALVTLLFVAVRQQSRLSVLSSAVDEAADGVQISDLGGHVVYSNRAVQAIYGFSPEELRGKHVNSMNVDPEFASRVILPEIQKQGHWEGELEVKHRDGHAFPIWLTTSIVLGPARRPIAAIGIIRDMTARRRAEGELRRYAAQLEDATRLKELFADVLRHDLLGPATALRMSIETLARRESDGANTRVVDQMRRSCTRLIDLIDHAARYAKISAIDELELEPIDLSRVLREAAGEVELALQERKPRIELRDGDGRWPVRANPLVREVFANLFSNAVKYGPDGGTVSVSVEDGGDCWVVAVADRGEGIRDADKDRVFTRFERLKREGVKGTGLGLAIAKRTVELHRGRIWVEDNPGGGALFRVALPKAPPEARAAMR